MSHSEQPQDTSAATSAADELVENEIFGRGINDDSCCCATGCNISSLIPLSSARVENWPLSNDEFCHADISNSSQLFFSPPNPASQDSEHWDPTFNQYVQFDDENTPPVTASLQSSCPSASSSSQPTIEYHADIAEIHEVENHVAESFLYIHRKNSGASGTRSLSNMSLIQREFGNMNLGSTNHKNTFTFSRQLPDMTIQSRANSVQNSAFHRRSRDTPFSASPPLQLEATRRGSWPSLSTHTRAEFPCQFENCTKTYKSNASLKYHVKRVHYHMLGEFECGTCGKVYTTNNRLTVHFRNHTGERPFSCSVPGCDYSTTQKCALTTHENRKHV